MMRRLRAFATVLVVATFASVAIGHGWVHKAARDAAHRTTTACVFCNHTVASGPVAVHLPALACSVETVVQPPALRPAEHCRPRPVARGPPSSSRLA